MRGPHCSKTVPPLTQGLHSPPTLSLNTDLARPCPTALMHALGMPDVCEPGHSHASAPHAAVLHKAAVQRGPPRLLREQLAAHAQPLVSPAHAG